MKWDLVRAWNMAARDLGIEVVAPDVLVLGVRGRTVAIAARVLSFGRAAGTVVLGRSSESAGVPEECERSGLHLSVLVEDQYGTYDRDLFIETLDDWGWHGSSAPPPWYAGRPWTG